MTHGFNNNYAWLDLALNTLAKL